MADTHASDNLWNAADDVFEAIREATTINRLILVHYLPQWTLRARPQDSPTRKMVRWARISLRFDPHWRHHNV